MAIRDPVVLAQVVGFNLFLWVGLYLLLRAGKRTPLIVAGVLALFSQALFFASSALSYTATNLQELSAIERWSWWSSVIPAATWFHFSSLSARQMVSAGERREGGVFNPLVVVVYTVAVCLSILGSVTDLIINYAEPIGQAGAYLYTGPGPAYVIYIAYLVLTLSGAFVYLMQALRAASTSREPADAALRPQLRLLAIGAGLFLVGALWISSRYNWNLSLPVLPGYAVVFAGLAGLAYGVAQFGMLLEGQNIRRDFFYTITGLGLINLLYVGLLSLAGLTSIHGMLALVGLVTLTHTAFDSGRNALDKLFFNQAEQAARAEAREYATVLGTAPVAASFVSSDEQPLPAPTVEPHPEAGAMEPGDEQSLKEFKNLVRKAITGLKSPPQLAKSPLLSLKLVERRVATSGLEDNRLNRAAVLRELLIEQIEGLRPTSSTEAQQGVGEAWRFYNVLYYPYVRELSRKSALAEARRLADERRRAGQRDPSELEQVLNWLADVDEDTFYKWQRRASDTIATILWEEHLKQTRESAH